MGETLTFLYSFHLAYPQVNTSRHLPFTGRKGAP
jgi:hypothetical protein